MNDSEAAAVPRRIPFFPGQRWSISCCAPYISSVLPDLAVVFLPCRGGYLADIFALTIWSGVGLTAISIWSNGIWLVQLRGQAILMKLILLGLMPLLPSQRLSLLLVILVISGVISHAPAKVRYYSLFHGRRIDSH